MYYFYVEIRGKVNKIWGENKNKIHQNVEMGQKKGGNPGICGNCRKRGHCAGDNLALTIEDRNLYQSSLGRIAAKGVLVDFVVLEGTYVTSRHNTRLPA